MFGPPKQRHTLTELPINRRRIIENLGGSVRICRVEQQPATKFGLQSNFSALRERLIDVEVLTDEIHGINLFIVNLVVKQIVEIGRVYDILAFDEILRDAGFESAHPLRFKTGIRIRIWTTGKRLLQSRLFEPGGVGKSQSRPGKKTAAAQRQ